MIFSKPRLVGVPLVALVSLMLVLVAPGRADATWSIIAVDPETGRVGAAMASCVPSGLLGDPDTTLVPVVLLPGRGVAITQGNINPDGPAGIRQLLNDGFTPDAAIQEMLAIDEVADARQYAVTLIEPAADGERTATFTGAEADAIAATETAELVSVQGVILADRAVLGATLEAYQAARAESRTLEQALVAGLAAGSAAGGDPRCGADQTALFAHLAVAGPTDDPFMPSVLLTVTVDEGDGQNPVPMLVDALADDRSGWINAGLKDPTGIPRVLVGAVGLVLAIAAYFTIRKGMGSPAARR